MRARPVLRTLLVGACVVGLAGCSGSKASTDDGPGGTSPYRLSGESPAPGHGVLILGGARYEFDVVNCGTGPVANDSAPETEGAQASQVSERNWGLYGNGHTEGKLFTVAVTQYQSQIGSGPVTITQSVLVRMDVAEAGSAGPAGPGIDTGEPNGSAVTTAAPSPTSTAPADSTTTTTVDDGVEHLGLTAQRYRLQTGTTWRDPRDPTATGDLVTITGDTYIATGTFGAAGDQPGAAGGQFGQVTARCPEGRSTS